MSDNDNCQILIIDDHDAMREGLELNLRRRGHRTYSASGGAEGLRLLEEEGADLVITDLKMTKVGGIEVLEKAKELAPNTDVLLITAHGTVEVAVQAMKLGACDFLTKPFSTEEFAIKVERVLRERKERLRLQKENLALRVENTYLRSERGEEAPYSEMIGQSPEMLKVQRLVERVANSESTVIVYGESGTGKELVARAVHARSGRRAKRFVDVNCGALPETLLDSELFGHEKGSFTGSTGRRRGLFEQANGGTLFLDEISSVTPSTQIRLLRVLQERNVQRVGGEVTIPVDVRIVAATNITADDLLSSGDFRADLFYRLHVFPITLPPLRERKEDIALLAQHFVDKLRARTRSDVVKVGAEALKVLEAYDWPGNVRELENLIERSLLLSEGEELTPEELPPLVNANTPSQDSGDGSDSSSDSSDDDLDLGQLVDDFEARCIRHALERANGIKAEAARLLRINKSVLYYKLEKYKIDA